MKKVESIVELNRLLNTFEGFKFETNAYFFENDFIGFIESETLFYDIFSVNIILYKYNREYDFFELFYYLREQENLIHLSDDATYVMEVPYRGQKNFPEPIVAFWERSGFVRHLNRDLIRLSVQEDPTFIPSDNNIEYKIIDDINLAELICSSIRDTFDTYTGHLLTLSEVQNFIIGKNFIGAYKDGELCGFLRFYVINNVAWASHLIVLPQFRALGIGNGLFSYFIKFNSDNGLRNLQHWVVSDNTTALKLYDKLGYKGTNKNSISLLKIKK